VEASLAVNQAKDRGTLRRTEVVDRRERERSRRRTAEITGVEFLFAVDFVDSAAHLVANRSKLTRMRLESDGVFAKEVSRRAE
jgi:hypothetical protein